MKTLSSFTCPYVAPIKPFFFFLCETQKEKFLRFRFHSVSHTKLLLGTEDVNYSHIDHFYETAMALLHPFWSFKKLQTLFCVIAWKIVVKISPFLFCGIRGMISGWVNDDWSFISGWTITWLTNSCWLQLNYLEENCLYLFIYCLNFRYNYFFKCILIISQQQFVFIQFFLYIYISMQWGSTFSMTV